MSVIASLISKRDGVVVSDGRLFGSALLDKGNVAEPATIDSDAFDKTFALGDGEVIGAFAGLMRFSRKTISEHVLEIGYSGKYDLQSLATEVEMQMKDRLEQLDDKEVIFPFRRLDILLVAGANFTRSNMQIIAIRLYPQERRIASEVEICPAVDRLAYCVRGDEKAWKAACRIFQANRAPNNDAAFMRKLITKAVGAGIDASGTHPHGSDAACGGRIFMRRTFYK